MANGYLFVPSPSPNQTGPSNLPVLRSVEKARQQLKWIAWFVTALFCLFREMEQVKLSQVIELAWLINFYLTPRVNTALSWAEVNVNQKTSPRGTSALNLPLALTATPPQPPPPPLAALLQLGPSLFCMSWSRWWWNLFLQKSHQFPNDFDNDAKSGPL